MCDNVEYLHDNETVVYKQTFEDLLVIKEKYNKLKEKITELKVKSKDFECCLEILNELEKILELLK